MNVIPIPRPWARFFRAPSAPVPYEKNPEACCCGVAPPRLFIAAPRPRSPLFPAPLRRTASRVSRDTLTSLKRRLAIYLRTVYSTIIIQILVPGNIQIGDISLISRRIYSGSLT